MKHLCFPLFLQQESRGYYHKYDSNEGHDRCTKFGNSESLPANKRHQLPLQSHSHCEVVRTGTHHSL